jgi:hypothetical protein
MIALFVLTIGLLGVLSLLSQSIFLSQTVGEQATATYLAAEGIEIAKNLVDHDIYGNREHVPGFIGWAQGGEDSTFQAGGDFELDYTTCNSLANPGLQCIPAVYNADPLNFDPATGLYSYIGPNVTGFTRDVKVIWQPATPNQMIVESIVQWSEGAVPERVETEDYFYNWQP